MHERQIEWLVVEGHVAEEEVGRWECDLDLHILDGLDVGEDGGGAELRTGAERMEKRVAGAGGGVEGELQLELELYLFRRELLIVLHNPLDEQIRHHDTLLILCMHIREH